TSRRCAVWSCWFSLRSLSFAILVVVVVLRQLHAQISFWNERFQQLIALPDTVQKWLDVARLCKDFIYTAENFCRVIVSEVNLPPEQKAIKPLQLGGVAGGHKVGATCEIVLFCFSLRALTHSSVRSIVALESLSSLQCKWSAKIAVLLGGISILF